MWIGVLWLERRGAAWRGALWRGVLWLDRNGVDSRGMHWIASPGISPIKLKEGKEMKHREIIRELEAIRAKSPDGLLRPAAVVKEAKAATHPLHAQFEWDDRKAGHLHRLTQARVLIVKVKIVNPNDLNAAPTPAYVSLMDDRQRPQGGYRHTVDVLGNDELAAELKATALKELRAWSQRYKALSELVDGVLAAAGIDEEVAV